MWYVLNQNAIEFDVVHFDPGGQGSDRQLLSMHDDPSLGRDIGYVAVWMFTNFAREAYLA